MGQLSTPPDGVTPSNPTSDGAARLPIGRLAAGTVLFSVAGAIELANESSSSPIAAVVMVGCLAASLALLLSAMIQPSSGWMAGVRWRHRALIRIGAAAALVLVATLTVSLAIGLIVTNEPAHAYGSDAAAFNHYNAELVLRGVNPYTADSRFWDAVSEFPNAGATPLRRGLYAGSEYGPSLQRLTQDVRYEISHPNRRGPEFDPASLHSYPALSFLVNAPFLAVGFPTTLPAMLLALLGFLVAAGWAGRRQHGVLLWLVLLCNPILALLTLRGSFDIVALLPALLAWRWLDRRWLSPVLLGIACAVKQIAWPLVPLYAVIVWRREGAKEAVRRLAVAGVAFIAPNAPFIVTDPVAWGRSMLLPMTLPVFPSGIGLVALSRAGLFPLMPSVVYGLLELAALGALVLWYARATFMPRPELALVLGLLPFLLAWHSATAYFDALPALAVYACIAALRTRGADEASPDSRVVDQPNRAAPRVVLGTTPI